MSYDYTRLCGRISEVCGSQADFSRRIGLSERSVSLKLNNRRGWKQSEIQRAAEILGLGREDIPIYFFDRKVQRE